MREYEVVYIFRPELESDDLDDRLGSFHERLDGEVTALEHWGQRELAYEIGGEHRGYYVVAQFRAEPASLEDFEQALDVDEDLLRHLLVVSEGELPVPPSQRREEEDEETEDEDEGDEDEDEGGDAGEDEDGESGDGGDDAPEDDGDGAGSEEGSADESNDEEER